MAEQIAWRSKRDGSIAYGNPDLWETRDEWEMVYIMTPAEFRKQTDYVWRAGYAEGEDDGYYRGLADAHGEEN